MAGWVVFTIKTTRKLHNPHNIFVANLMITDIISAVSSTILISIMFIEYATGVRDFIGCRFFIFLLFPKTVIQCTYLMISVDKVIAVAFPFKHRKIMKRPVIIGLITAAWLASILLHSRAFISVGYTKRAQYGTCISDGNTFVFTVLAFVLPVFAVSLIVIILNVYLSYKAYQAQRKIQEESRLSGTTSNEAKKKQATIKTHLKPMKTLLIVVSGSVALGLIFPMLYIPAGILNSPVFFEIVHILIPNIAYLMLLFHPFVYGLYYRQVRESMMKVLKRITCRNKFNSAVVAPQR